MRYQVSYNVAKDGVHYLGLTLRHDTGTPKKADEVLKMLQNQYPKSEGYSVSASLTPIGISLGVAQDSTISEAREYMGTQKNP